MALGILKKFRVTSHTILSNSCFQKKAVMTIPGLEQAEVPPLGELGMAGVLPDGLRDPEKGLSDFSYCPQQLCLTKLCSIINPGLDAIGVLPLDELFARFTGVLGQIEKIDLYHVDQREKLKGLEVQYLA